ncbi:formylglycine-generating enzyme family protein [bacterium]|nr:formylglycine-generating enzyme family protein [bacterium]
MMGSDTGEPDERPRQYVFVDRYYIDLYEVSNRDYAEFLAFTGRTAPPHWKNAAYPEGADDYPVNNVSYADAEAFAAWAGKRLPTEREWEKAARGQDGRIYSWGDVFDASSCNTWESRRGEPAPVDAFPDARSPFGLYNCVGNVWEWVDAWYDAYPESTYRRAEFGQTYRVLRGGGWNMDAYYARCSARYFLEPRFRHPSFGFRCAMSPAQYEAVK